MQNFNDHVTLAALVLVIAGLLVLPRVLRAHELKKFQDVVNQMLSDIRGDLALFLMDRNNKRAIVNWLGVAALIVFQAADEDKLIVIESISSGVKKEIDLIVENDKSGNCASRVEEVSYLMLGTMEDWSARARARNR